MWADIRFIENCFAELLERNKFEFKEHRNRIESKLKRTMNTEIDYDG